MCPDYAERKVQRYPRGEREHVTVSEAARIRQLSPHGASEETAFKTRRVHRANSLIFGRSTPTSRTKLIHNPQPRESQQADPLYLVSACHFTSRRTSSSDLHSRRRRHALRRRCRALHNRLRRFTANAGVPRYYEPRGQG